MEIILTRIMAKIKIIIRREILQQKTTASKNPFLRNKVMTKRRSLSVSSNFSNRKLINVSNRDKIQLRISLFGKI